MNRLWAPWRREFVEAEPPEGCIFCELPAESGAEADRRNLIIARSAHSFVILNRYPYTSGHLLVVPRRHLADLEALPPEEMNDLSALLQESLARLRAAYRPDACNVGMNLGRAAGAGIADHLHWHVLPRWAGDTNFATAVAETRVLVELLDQTWERLSPFFAAAR